MQINIVTGNLADMRVGANSLRSNMSLRQNGNAVQTNAESVFGPQCKVTISREGRRLSEQSKSAEQKSFTAAATERLLLRQQKQNEADKNEQSDTINEISELISSIKNSYAAGEDKETIENKQEALNRLLDLKARQEEENKQRVEDAAGNAAGASRDQEEIDRKNADLYLILKTLEEQEKDEEENAGGSETEYDAEGTDAQQNTGDRFQESASALGASAAKRELQAKGMIDGMFDRGYSRLAEADAMMREVQAELDLAEESLGKANLSEDEKYQLMSEHTGRANNMMLSNYGEMMDLRRKGHQEIRDAQELELRHIAVNPLDGVDRAKQAIMEAGVTAAFNEVSQGALDKASEELEERVQDAIDRRDDVVSDPDEDEEQVKAEEAREEEKDEALEEQEESEKKSNLMN